MSMSLIHIKKCPWKNTKNFLTSSSYLTITTCYRSWPQLICDAIHQELLQLGANIGDPAFLDSHPTVWPNADEAVLACDIHHLVQIRKVYGSSNKDFMH